jgi:hypothetical protein
MEIVAHGLWAAAAAITAKKTSTARISIGWSVWWTAFPDVLAFGPVVAIGLKYSHFYSNGIARDPTGEAPRRPPRGSQRLLQLPKHYLCAPIF